MKTLRSYIATPSHPASLSAAARRRRWAQLSALFPDIARMRVIDLGGTPAAWRASGLVPRELVIVNLSDAELEGDRAVDARIVLGDACDLPSEIRGDRFDLVYSNSVIEHVGGHARREAFAENVHALAPNHWVQTPYRYFPVEPHWVFPVMQHLPVTARAAVLRHWGMGGRARTRQESIRRVLGVELLSKTEMAHYFPHSDITTEQFLGLPKSLVAVRRGT